MLPWEKLCKQHTASLCTVSHNMNLQLSQKKKKKIKLIIKHKPHLSLSSRGVRSSSTARLDLLPVGLTRLNPQSSQRLWSHLRCHCLLPQSHQELAELVLWLWQMVSHFWAGPGTILSFLGPSVASCNAALPLFPLMLECIFWKGSDPFRASPIRPHPDTFLYNNSKSTD